ncbi:hypothetical protein [Gorillibacterium sp. CAU 1737]|uniref:hypothetical protein n=1 Tax=Gorillibacterium sp. CAU 1737 TaxID=3140362 RepID=UPI00325FE012
MVNDVAYPIRPEDRTNTLIMLTLQYQAQVNERINGVSDSIGVLQADNEALKEALRQVAENQFAASKEGEGMIEAITELKTKTDSIDSTVRSVERDVAVLKNTVDIGFKDLREDIRELKQTIEKLNSPIEQLRSDMICVKKDTEFIKEKSEKTASGRKWTVTTIIAAAGLLATIFKIVYDLVK